MHFCGEARKALLITGHYRVRRCKQLLFGTKRMCDTYCAYERIHTVRTCDISCVDVCNHLILKKVLTIIDHTAPTFTFNNKSISSSSNGRMYSN